MVLPRRPDLPEKLSVSLFQSGIRGDYVTVDERGGLLLAFAPPAVAWSTRLYPRRRMPPISNYIYTFNIWRQPQGGQLRVSMKGGGSIRRAPNVALQRTRRPRVGSGRLPPNARPMGGIR